MVVVVVVMVVVVVVMVVSGGGDGGGGGGGGGPTFHSSNVFHLSVCRPSSSRITSIARQSSETGFPSATRSRISS